MARAETFCANAATGLIEKNTVVDCVRGDFFILDMDSLDYAET